MRGSFRSSFSWGASSFAQPRATCGASLTNGASASVKTVESGKWKVERNIRVGSSCLRSVVCPVEPPAHARGPLKSRSDFGDSIPDTLRVSRDTTEKPRGSFPRLRGGGTPPRSRGPRASPGPLGGVTKKSSWMPRMMLGISWAMAWLTSCRLMGDMLLCRKLGGWRDSRAAANSDFSRWRLLFRRKNLLSGQRLARQDPPDDETH